MFRLDEYQKQYDISKQRNILGAWRMQLWVRKFQKKQAVKKVFDRASSKATLIKKRLRTAGVLHKMNSGKRLLKGWLQHTQKTLYMHRKTGMMRKLTTLQGCFEKWRRKSAKRFTLKKYLGVWRGTLAESRNGLRMSQELMRTRLREAAFQIWRRKHHRVQALEERAEVYRKIQEDHQRRRILVGMQKLCQVRVLLVERVEEWRRVQIKQKYLRSLQKICMGMRKANRHYQQGLKNGALLAWRGAYEKKQENEELKLKLFREWRQQANSKIAMQRFFKEKLLTQVARYHPSSAMWEQLNASECKSYDATNRLISGAKCFLHWRHRAKKQRKLRGLQQEFMLKSFAKKFSIWRGEALVRWSKRREPQVLTKFFLGRWREQVGMAREAEEARNVRLADYQVGREYIRTYAAFKRWEQLFQVHKIEEHLCEQNLKVYTLRRKAVVLRQLRLHAMGSLFTRYREREHRMGSVFGKWLQRSKLVVGSRKKRVQRRFVERWRDMVEVSQAQRVSAVFRKRKLHSRMLKWTKALQMRKCEWQWATDMRNLHVLKRCMRVWRGMYQRPRKEVGEAGFVSTKPLVQIPVMDLPVTPVRKDLSGGVIKGGEVDEEKKVVMDWFSGLQPQDEDDIFMTPIAKAY